MNKCELCQEICNNLTKIYNNRIKTLAQIILKLKGFKELQEINNSLIICENCRQGIDNVATFWEHIPEAKQENISNNATSSLQEIYETSPATNSQKDVVTYNRKNISVMEVEKYDEPKKPIKLKIKKVKEEKNVYALVSLNSTEEYSSKRLRRPPKRYNDFNVDFSFKSEKVIMNRKKIKESSLMKLPAMATIRSVNGIKLGNLFEVENNGQTSRMRIVCEICSSIFSYEKEFQMHRKIHQTNKDFDILKAISHTEYLFHCKLCEKSFKEHYAVRRHYKFAHSEERSFKCEHCSASFKYKFNLDYHMAKHIPKKRFECSYCKKTFVMRYELKIHLRTHTKERPYKCEFCSYAFAHSSNLKAHQKIKHSKHLSVDNPSQDTITVEGKNQKESHTDCENNLNEVKDVEISLFDQSNNNEEHLNSFAVKYKSKELLLDEPKYINSLSRNSKSSPSQIKCKSEEFVKPSDVIPIEGDNRIVLRSSTNIADNLIYDYRKQFTACTSLYPFKIANTALRIIPQSSLLTMKKWPKSYQRAITESSKSSNSEEKSIITEYEILNQTNENVIFHMNRGEANGSFLESYEFNNRLDLVDMQHSTMSFCEKLNNNNEKFDPAISQPHNKVDTKTTENSFSSKSNKDTCNSISANVSSESVNRTQQSKDTLYAKIKSDSDFGKKQQLNKDSSFYACSNTKNIEGSDAKSSLKLNSNITLKKSYLKNNQKFENSEKPINVGKYSKFSPVVLDPNFSGKIHIMKVSNTTKEDSKRTQLFDNSNDMNTEIIINKPLKTHNMSRIQPKAKSQKGNEIKVSTKPVKILNPNNSRNCNSMLKTSNKITLKNNINLKEISILKSANKTCLNSDNSLITKTVFKGKESKIAETAENSISESLLRPEILKTNNFIENLSNKPLITKVEILPSLNFSLPLQKSLSPPVTAQSTVQPPKEYKHQCSHCWKYFKQKSTLTKHLRTHTGEKPYKCNLCPKSYADASNYKKHKILHKNAAEALNISSSTTAHLIQNSPAHSTVSDPDPDGIEVMQTIKTFQSSPSDENDMYDDDENVSLTSSTMESYMWQDVLDNILSNNEIHENIKRNLACLNNAIMPNNLEQQLARNDFSSTYLNRSLPCEDPD